LIGLSVLPGAARRAGLSSSRLGSVYLQFAHGVPGFGAGVAFGLHAHRSDLALFAFGAAGVAFAMYCVLLIGL